MEEGSTGHVRSNRTLVWKCFLPGIILMTLTGSVVRGLTSRVVIQTMLWVYSILVLLTCVIAPSPFVILWSMCTSWNVNSALMLFFLLWSLTFPFYALSNMKLGHDLKDICLLFDKLEFGGEAKFLCLIKTINVCLPAYAAVQSALFHFVMMDLYNTGGILIVPFAVGVWVKFFSSAQVLCVCFLSAIACFQYSDFLRREVQTMENGQYPDGIEKCRMKYEDLMSAISRVDECVHLSIALILSVDMFLICCFFFIMMTGHEDIQTWIICTSFASEIILVCLSCGLVKYLVSENLKLNIEYAIHKKV